MIMASSDRFVGQECGSGFLSISYFEFLMSLVVGWQCEPHPEVLLETGLLSHRDSLTWLAGVGPSTDQPDCPHKVTAGIQQHRAGDAVPL